MNEITESILSRRSVRKYKSEQVPQETLQDVIKAGIYAPNGGNMQQWHFTAIQNAEILKELNELIKKAFAMSEDSPNPFIKSGIPYAKSEQFCFYYGAPSLVLISSDKANPNAMADCACAAENVQLAAYAEGLGSVFVNQPTWFDDNPDVRALLTRIGVPENYHVGASVALGYTEVRPAQAARKEDVVNYVK